MRRWIAARAIMLTASVLITGIAGPVNAQVTATDPVDALKRRLVNDHGVKFSEVSTTTIDRQQASWMKDDQKNVFRTKGVAEFGEGKVVATDRTHRSDSDKSGDFMRWITFEGRTYTQGWILPSLPAGKNWILSGNKETELAVASGRIRLTDPATLKAVLATTSVKRPAGVYDGTRTTLHQGKITFGELRKAFPGFRLESNEKPATKHLKIEISWRLWLGEDQLVRRAWSSWTEPLIKNLDIDVFHVTDTHLTGWGAKTDVAPPPADQVITSDDPAPVSDHTLLNPTAG